MGICRFFFPIHIWASTCRRATMLNIVYCVFSKGFVHCLFVGLDKIGGFENLIPAYMNATPTVGIDNSTCGLPRPDAMSVLRDPGTGDYPWPSMILQCGLASAWYWICDQVVW